MALAPIQLISDFMEDYPNHWLKLYEQGTTTPLAMAIDSTGSPTVAKAEISAGPTPPLGLIKTAGNVTFIPYVTESYDAYLFPTEAEADANDTVNAIQLADNVDPFLSAEDQIAATTSMPSLVDAPLLDIVYDSVAEMKAADIVEGMTVDTASFAAGWAATIGGASGGATYDIVTKAEHDTVRGKSTVDGFGDHTLANGLVALISNIININTRQYGATGDGVTDDKASIQGAINAGVLQGKSIFSPSGRYLTLSGLVIDLSGVTSDTAFRPSFVGEGRGLTTIFHTGAGVGLAVLGGVPGTAGSHAYLTVSDIRFEGAAVVVAGSQGLQLDNLAYFVLRDITVISFAKGIQATDILSSELEKVNCRFNDEGMSFNFVNMSRPNAISLVDCVIGNCAINGITVVEPGLFTMRGGSIEGCGNDPAGYGIKVVDGGTESAIGVNLEGVYFENNEGIADVHIVQTGRICLNVIKACSFARISSTKFTEANVKFEPSNASTLSLVANGFTELGTYVVDSGRPYIDTSGASGSWGLTDLGNRYRDEDSRPDDAALTSDEGVAQVRGEIDTNGDIVNSKGIGSIVKFGTGDFKIVYSRPMRGPANQVLATTKVGSSGPPLIACLVAQDNSSCQIKIFNAAGTVTDPISFSVAVFGDLFQGW